jgi:flagellar hook-basal body complex protein FliE
VTNAISQIAPIELPKTVAPGISPASQPGAFQSVLEGTIQSLESLNRAAADSAEKFLTGQNEELHTTILATERASLAFDLGLQVRNKVVDAYQEVMRMQL